MSRSGYVDDWDDPGSVNLYRGVVLRALHGKRGQAFLRELVAALDALPSKRLIAGKLVTEGGECCAIGSVFRARGLSVAGIDPYAADEVGAAVGVAKAMAAEIEYENDDGGRYDETPEQRWERMRSWASGHMMAEAEASAALDVESDIHTCSPACAARGHKRHGA